ncbi:aminoglycoside N(3)-acetyltransferase [Halomicrobium salinisoli]|uniref:aminoglycoside N(3)-acetyltransferase n=1 Tax=Halomicrobium salinisoli TaxID=2878391 RepID=UPI001CEFC032|nr:AAC(3) family N-acetyltransferase [Halomicrobium salinisoli]
MTDETVVDRTDDPVTADRIASDLRDLGVAAGDALLVHASLSSLGWVPGREQAAVDALFSAVTESGTLAMPTHSPQLCDPAGWSNPPVPDEWLDEVRASMPAFRPDATPTRGMGAIPECFRSCPGVVRSDHPQVSFAARGAEAERVVADHSLDYALGEDSPLATLYDLDADVLMLGTDHDTCTSLHLAEYRADCPTETDTVGAPVARDGERVWTEYEDIEWDDGDFADLGADFEREVGLTEGTVGQATAKLVSQRELVDFAVDWFEQHRG